MCPPLVRAILAHRRGEGPFGAEQPATEAPGLNATSGLETNSTIGFQTQSLGHTSRVLNTLQVSGGSVGLLAEEAFMVRLGINQSTTELNLFECFVRQFILTKGAALIYHPDSGSTACRCRWDSVGFHFPRN